MQDARGRVTSLVIWNFPEPVVLPAAVETVFVNRERRRYRFFRVEEAGSVRPGRCSGCSDRVWITTTNPYRTWSSILAASPLLNSKPRSACPWTQRIHYHTVNPTRLTDVEPEA